MIINISYGVSAGGKNGGTFLEAQIAREIELARQYNQEVEVVYAYGNSRNERLLADFKLEFSTVDQEITWVLPPDSTNPAFLEIREVVDTPDGKRLDKVPDDIEIYVESPNRRSSLDRHRLSPNITFPSIDPQLQAKDARLYAVDGVDVQGNRSTKAQPYTCIAIAPTRRLNGNSPVAKPGDWKLKFRNTSDKSVRLILQIQRGDRAAGTPYGGRQSWFEGHFKRDIVDDEWVGWDVVLPLTNKGTNSRYTTAKAQGKIHTVGANRAVPGGGSIRAEYSAEDSEWQNQSGPSSKVDVDGIFIRGQLAAGTYSGTTTRLSGTSAAAAIHTRKLLA